MAINLITKYADHLSQKFREKSFLAGKTSNEFKWNGLRHCEIMSIVTQPLGDYNRTLSANRYGTPTELQDTLQDIEITQDKSFTLTIDKGNNTQQGMLKSAGKAMDAQINERVVPLIDKYALKMFARYGGTTVAASAALSKTNIIETLTAIEDTMSDNLVPMDGRYAFMANSTVSLFRQSLTNCDTVTEKLLLKGVAGRFGSLNIVGIPSSWLPDNTLIIAFHKSSVVMPQQIYESKVHIDPPGISGNLLEGRYVFDAAVVAAKNMGVYTLVANGKKCSTTVAVSGTTATITAGNADAAYYTLDGTDPRYSPTRTAWTSGTITVASGATIKVMGYKTDGSYGSSDVASATAS